MAESIIVALIGGAFSLIGIYVTTRENSKRIEAQLSTAQAVTDTKIEELTREVHEHNNFARRMPVVEQQINDIKDDVTTLKGYHMK